MDFGYHNAMQRSMLLYNSCLENMKNSHQSSIDCIVKCVQELDPSKDKQSLLHFTPVLVKLLKVQLRYFWHFSLSLIDGITWRIKYVNRLNKLKKADRVDKLR